MNLDAGDWIAIIAVIFSAGALYIAWLTKKAAEDSASTAKDALQVAQESAESAKLSAHAADRSATADERAVQLQEGQAANQRAKWDAKMVPNSMNLTPGIRKAKLSNVGDEVALDVRISGPFVIGSLVSKEIHKGESIEFNYSAESFYLMPWQKPVSVTVKWKRPKEFGGATLTKEIPISEA